MIDFKGASKRLVSRFFKILIYFVRVFANNHRGDLATGIPFFNYLTVV